jgi:hypothetical protein
MIFRTLFFVIPTSGLPVIPAAESESHDCDSFQDSGTPDRRFRGNDVFISGNDAPVPRVDAFTGLLL